MSMNLRKMPISTDVPIVRATSVTIGNQRVHLGGPSHAEDEDEPAIELVRKGDEIVAIEVTCSCGKNIRIECDYQAE